MGYPYDWRYDWAPSTWVSYIFMASHARPGLVRGDVFQGGFLEVASIVAPGVTTTTLTVSGPSVLQSASATFLSVASAITSASVSTGMLGTSGAATVGGTLTVVGGTTLGSVGATSGSFSGSLSATTLSVSGATTLQGASATSLSVSGAAALGAVTATSVASTTASVSGTATLGTANVTTLAVAGSATFSGGLVVPTGQTLALQGTATITAAGAGAIALTSGAIATSGALSGGSAAIAGALTAGSAAVTGALTVGSVATTSGSISATSGNLSTTSGRVLAPNLGPFGHSSGAPQALGDVFPVLVVPSGRTMLLIADSSLLGSANPNAPGFPQLSLIRTADQTCDRFTVFNNSRYPLQLVPGVGAETATDKQIAAYAAEYNVTGNVFWPTTAMTFYRDVPSGRWVGVANGRMHRAQGSAPGLVIDDIAANGQITLNEEIVIISAGMGTTSTGQALFVEWTIDFTVSIGAIVPTSPFKCEVPAPWQSVSARWPALPYPWMELNVTPFRYNVGTGWLFNGASRAARITTNTPTKAFMEMRPRGSNFQEAETGDTWSVSVTLPPVINIPATL